MTDAERIHLAIQALELVEKYVPVTEEDRAIGKALEILRKPAPSQPDTQSRMQESANQVPTYQEKGEFRPWPNRRMPYDYAAYADGTTVLTTYPDPATVAQGSRW